MPPLARPLVVYDGDCGFCRRCVARARRLTGDRVDYLPYQEAAARFPAIGAAEFAAAVHLLLPDGSVRRGADAVLRTLELGGHGAGAWAYERIPGFAPLAEAAYRFVARHRGRLGRRAPPPHRT